MTSSWLVYRSHPRVSPWPATILDIARSSERHNTELGISGLLLYSSSAYLQLLEGSDAALAAVWGRIEQDDRHALDWIARGKGDVALAALPLGYFDADREQLSAPLNPLWRDRSSWTADRASDLREMLISIGRGKYPSIAGR